MSELIHSLHIVPLLIIVALFIFRYLFNGKLSYIFKKYYSYFNLFYLLVFYRPFYMPKYTWLSMYYIECRQTM